MHRLEEPKFLFQDNWRIVRGISPDNSGVIIRIGHSEICSSK
jgi:hypothetical protein